MVSEICTGRYGAPRARERGARGQERAVGRSAGRAPVGMAEEIPVRQPRNGRLVLSGGKESAVGDVMDRAYTAGRIGGGDAMVLCKSMRGLPTLSEENF